MEKVASIIKYRGNRDKFIHWLSELPKRPHPYEISKVLESLHEGIYILWTEKDGLKIL